MISIYTDDYVGSSAERISCYVGFSLESAMTDDPKVTNSVLPVENQECRVLNYEDLSMISFEMTASKLAVDTLEVRTVFHTYISVLNDVSASTDVVTAATAMHCRVVCGHSRY